MASKKSTAIVGSAEPSTLTVSIADISTEEIEAEVADKIANNQRGRGRKSQPVVVQPEATKAASKKETAPVATKSATVYNVTQLAEKVKSDGRNVRRILRSLAAKYPTQAAFKVNADSGKYEWTGSSFKVASERVAKAMTEDLAAQKSKKGAK